MDGNLDHKDLSGGAAVLSLGAQRDDRLDTALAFVLAFGVLGGVAFYATQPVISGLSLWSSTQPQAAVVAPALPAPEAAASADLLPRTAPSDAAPDLMPLPAAVAADSTAVPGATASAAAVVLPASAPVIAPVVAPVVSVPPAATPPLAVASAAPVIAAVEVPTPAPPVVAVAAPKVVIRENIQFGVNLAEVPDSAKARLDAVAKLLASDPRNLTIAGHTDSSGKPGVNTILSLKRAEAVRAYLVAQGASADRLKAVGMGAKSPIADNKTEAGRAQNRRIDITE